MPLAIAFATIPISNRCFFMAQYEWAKRRIRAMIRVCHFLWDHADAIDLDESGTPVKVLFENMAELIEDRKHDLPRVPRPAVESRWLDGLGPGSHR